MIKEREVLGNDRIFNHNIRKFFYIDSIHKSYKKNNSVEFLCSINDSIYLSKPEWIKEKVKSNNILHTKIILEFYKNDIFRIMMTIPNKSFPEQKISDLLLQKNNLVPFYSSIRELKSKIEIKLENITLNVNKNPWQITVIDKKNNIIFSENRTDIDGFNRFISFPIGYLYDKNIKRYNTFETINLYPDEQIYGLGEKFLPITRKGQRIISWNVDPICASSTDMAYKNIPFLLSTHGYGIFINKTSKIVYEIGTISTITYSFCVDDESLDYFFIYGPQFKQILNKYTQITGKAPVPPKWSFGVWMSRCMYKSRTEVETIAKKLRILNIPCDVIHIDPLWLKGREKSGIDSCHDLVFDTKKFPEPEKMVTNLKKMGFKLSLWENPYVLKGTKIYEEGVKKHYFPISLTDKNKPAQIEPPNKPKIFTTLIDFTNPDAVKWYQEKHRKLLNIGVAVFKTDYGEWCPINARFYNGMIGKDMHNLYPVLYNKTVFDIIKKVCGKGIVWARSAYAGSQMYPVHWSGDTLAKYEVMAQVLRSGLSIGLSGIPFWSHDIGGFIGKPSQELYIRWTQFGMFCSHSRFHGTTPREPWEYGKKAIDICKKYILLRYRLIPYIYSYAYIANKTGIPIVRAMVLEFQDDHNTYDKDLQYMFGRELLVAPIFNETNIRNIYLPAGKWLDYWDKKEYTGPINIRYYAPLDRLPLFIRENSIIPYCPQMNYIGEKPFNKYVLDCYILSKAEFVLYDDNEIIKFSGIKNRDVLVFSISKSNKEYEMNFYKITVKRAIIETKTIKKFDYKTTDTGTKIKFIADGNVIFKLYLK